MAFIDDIKRAYLQGSMLMRLILINIGAFVLLHVLALGSLLVGGQATSLLQWVELPSDLTWLIRRPWTLVTYMFSHYGLLHILFNMLWLYWLGRIFMEFFSPKQLTGLYLLGGWGGALFYLLAFNLLPHFQGTQGFLIGASACLHQVGGHSHRAHRRAGSGTRQLGWQHGPSGRCGGRCLVCLAHQGWPRHHATAQRRHRLGAGTAVGPLDTHA